MSDKAESTTMSTIMPLFLRRPAFWAVAAVVTIFVASGLASIGASAITGFIVAAIVVAGLIALSALRAR